MAAGTLTLIGLGMAAFGTATQVRGQLVQGRAARDAGLAQQRAANASAQAQEAETARLEYNAGVADSLAKDSLQRGFEAESSFRSQIRGLISSQRAGFAASGVRVDHGSAFDVTSDARRLGERDVDRIRVNAQREAFGYRAQAADLRMGADTSRRGAAAIRQGGQAAAAAGRAAQTAARWGAASTILGTGSSLLLQRYGWGSGEAA